MSATSEEASIPTASGKRKLVYNEELPKEIRRALVHEARSQDVRVNDIAGEALAAHFKTKWVPSGQKYRVERAKVDKIKVTEELWRRIREEALLVEGGTMRGVVLSVLSEHFKLGLLIPRTRKPRSRRETQ